MQKEVVERILAKESERKRGSLTCWVEVFADVELVTRVPRGAFFPAPKVESAVIKLTCKKEPLLEYSQAEEFEVFLRQLFVQPRKKARNNLPNLKTGVDLPRNIQEYIQLRPFQMSLSQVLEIYFFQQKYLAT